MPRIQMQQSGVPVIPGSEGFIDNVEEARKIAEKSRIPGFAEKQRPVAAAKESEGSIMKKSLRMLTKRQGVKL
mgnify:CR=1 FL=1